MKDKHPKGIICLPDYKDCRKADKTECAKKFSFVLIPDPVSCHLHIHCKHTCYAKHKYRSSTRVECHTHRQTKSHLSTVVNTAHKVSTMHTS